jgi:hypothetical protein
MLVIIWTYATAVTRADFVANSLVAEDARSTYQQWDFPTPTATQPTLPMPLFNPYSPANGVPNVRTRRVAALSPAAATSTRLAWRSTSM